MASVAIARDHREIAAAHEFAEAILADDVERFGAALVAVDRLGITKPAFRRLCMRMPNVSDGIRAHFLTVWRHHGDHIRDEVDDDRILVRALRLLLPRYAGPGMTLFRGDSMFNRRRKTYGVAWSADENVADTFAQGIWQHLKSGSVVLRAEVPAVAIIATIDEAADHYGEREFLVDRRLLQKVEVLRSYAEKFWQP